MTLVVFGLFVMSAISGIASTFIESMMFGVAMCISSTSVVKTMMNKRNLTQTHVAFAKRLLAIGSINELMVGVILAIPVAVAGGMDVFVRIFFTVVIFGLASVSFRSHIAPSAFNYISTRPGVGKNVLRALVFLSTISWCLLFALSTDILGLSIEAGAFVSGIYLAGMSNVQDISEMLSAVSTLMGAMYFGSVGMILNIDWTIDHAISVMSIVFMATFVKVIAAVVILVFIFKMPSKSALLAGVALAQVGDFSLVFVSKARRLDLIGRDLYLHLLVSIVIMMTALPALLRYLFKVLSSSVVSFDLNSNSDGNNSRIASLIEMGETTTKKKNMTNNNKSPTILPVSSSSTSQEADDGDLHEL